MLYSLILNLIDNYSFLNVFKYLTVRTGLAVFTSLLVVFLIGSPFIQYGLKRPDRSVISSVVAIAGSLTTPTDPPTEAWPFLDANSPKMKLWIGSDDAVVAASGAQRIKDKYNMLERSNDCVLSILSNVPPTRLSQPETS